MNIVKTISIKEFMDHAKYFVEANYEEKFADWTFAYDEGGEEETEYPDMYGELMDEFGIGFDYDLSIDALFYPFMEVVRTYENTRG